MCLRLTSTHAAKCFYIPFLLDQNARKFEPWTVLFFVPLQSVRVILLNRAARVERLKRPHLNSTKGQEFTSSSMTRQAHSDLQCDGAATTLNDWMTVNVRSLSKSIQTPKSPELTLWGLLILGVKRFALFGSIHFFGPHFTLFSSNVWLVWFFSLFWTEN